MSYPKSEMKCGNCRCWEKLNDNKDEHYGVCHRFPPISNQAVELHETYWCFEFYPANPEFKDYTY